jgi:hypothetical protein
MDIAGQHLIDGRTGRNGRHDLVGMLRQSVFGRLAGYEDVNDADRLGRDPAMRWILGGKANRARERDEDVSKHSSAWPATWFEASPSANVHAVLQSIWGMSAE